MHSVHLPDAENFRRWPSAASPAEAAAILASGKPVYYQYACDLVMRPSNRRGSFSEIINRAHHPLLAYGFDDPDHLKNAFAEPAVSYHAKVRPLHCEAYIDFSEIVMSQKSPYLGFVVHGDAPRAFIVPSYEEYQKTARSWWIGLRQITWPPVVAIVKELTILPMGPMISARVPYRPLVTELDIV